jgi:hypothetical protein
MENIRRQETRRTATLRVLLASLTWRHRASKTATDRPSSRSRAPGVATLSTVSSRPRTTVTRVLLSGVGWPV